MMLNFRFRALQTFKIPTIELNHTHTIFYDMANIKFKFGFIANI